MNDKHGHSAISTAGLLIALGIIYGDIGTSPLYVMKAIVPDVITQDLVYGGISCVLWTLTLQTTIKYVLLTLNADNNGEGGIFSLYALVRRRGAWLSAVAIVGGAALLADGVITPPISVSSAIEGLEAVYPGIPTMYIVIAILCGLFLLQSFGTQIVGKAFGPIMFLWFSMLAVLGVYGIVHHPEILKAANPYYAYNLLVNTPGGFWLLGAVFLCTTGAEALYSDLGHCGKGNIRISWMFVKLCLLLNYFGQGGWLMAHAGEKLAGRNPFYSLMPEWFLLIGIGIATIAAIIASQALITGSFTLVAEAIRLNMWPKVRLNYPTNVKGQLYVPSMNRLLLLGCIAVVLYFQRSEHMEAAYGLAITITMLMTTLLLSMWLRAKRVPLPLVGLFLMVYGLIEGSFLIANLIKFPHGGWVSVAISLCLILVMYVWLRAYFIKRRLTEFVKIEPYIDALKELSNDESISKYATHLVFMSSAERQSEIESKIIYSIFQKRPKRADIYWFVHVDTTDEPYTMEYKVTELAPDDVFRITFRLGFRVEQRINLYFRKVVEDLVRNKEVDITSRYESLSKQHVTGDFRFVVLEKFLSVENDFPWVEKLVMQAYFYIKQFIASEDKYFGLDTSSVKVEKVPLVITPVREVSLQRVQ
ncbi:KUP/HAK/KT family potassium transporter [Hymenobacter lutimineralis]|uniref:Probable potassium transport system protein Kup n=1 Tax=Hymenobacter lutimineralis TaxID=2606448 RepID=A0A5D6UX12_9BACT|nr:MULTISPECIES: KUP/HAK/KT family potassium transporter [Hymenobacter]QIX63323.1 KUP/HAK/KT family potassium transporter [Hymenobacter sp. BT18]TYZ08116.1 KUP/HAK/KT family potassium transporter [Hymenobacter lutimineralis]